MIPNKIWLSSDESHIETYCNGFFVHVYYSKRYSDAKFDRAISLLKDADPREMTFKQFEIICNAIDFLEEEDE